MCFIVLYDEAPIKPQDGSSGHRERDTDKHGQGPPSIGTYPPPHHHQNGQAFGLEKAEGQQHGMTTLQQIQSEAEEITTVQGQHEGKSSK